jgi:hypothetical protein
VWVSKDRAAPFSRKHRRYWIPVTGGMVAIMLVNVIVGLVSYPKDVSDKHEKIHLNIPPPGTPQSAMTRDAGVPDAPH